MEAFQKQSINATFAVRQFVFNPLAAAQLADQTGNSCNLPEVAAIGQFFVAMASPMSLEA